MESRQEGPRRLVLCADGTWNRGGPGRPTNVWRLHQAIDRSQPNQLTFHDNGVGTGKGLASKILGGAFGFGLYSNVRDLYEFLVQHYRPGDRIYLFGFSRGAFTVRLLSGVIACCGILDLEKLKKHEEGRVTDAREAARLAVRTFRLAHSQAVRQSRGGPLARLTRFLGATDDDEAATMPDLLRQQFAHPPDEDGCNIEFIGAWDTVRAFGGPFDEVVVALNWALCLSFQDNRLAPNVRRAAQALAIDEARQSFAPIQWEPEERVAQKWFVGAHSDIGGGYEKQGLASATLAWMIEQIGTDPAERGIAFSSAARDLINAEADPHGELHDSRRGVGLFYRYRPRELDGGDLHQSARVRLDTGTGDYAPTNVPLKEGGSINDSMPGRVQWRSRLHLAAALALLATFVAVPVVSKATDAPPAPGNTGESVLYALATAGTTLSPFDALDARLLGLYAWCVDQPRAAWLVLGTIIVLALTSGALGQRQRSRARAAWRRQRATGSGGNVP